eukprot:14189-Heterococcus_DN1.PRE.2
MLAARSPRCRAKAAASLSFRHVYFTHRRALERHINNVVARHTNICNWRRFRVSANPLLHIAKDPLHSCSTLLAHCTPAAPAIANPLRYEVTRCAKQNFPTRDACCRQLRAGCNLTPTVRSCTAQHSNETSSPSLILPKRFFVAWFRHPGLSVRTGKLCCSNQLTAKYSGAYVAEIRSACVLRARVLDGQTDKTNVPCMYSCSSRSSSSRACSHSKQTTAVSTACAAAKTHCTASTVCLLAESRCSTHRLRTCSKQQQQQQQQTCATFSD